MIFGSVCSGIGCADLAFTRLGWRCAFQSEIAPFPRAVLRHRFPDVPLRGDFTEIEAGDHEAVDALVGGTPCQSFSIAGLRGGMADERGNLALQFLLLAKRLRPRWVVWENVPGVLSSNGGRDFGAFLGGLGECGYGYAYRVLDAQFFGLAQRRARVFVVGYLGDWRPAAAVLFEPACLRGDPPPRRDQGQGVAGAIASQSDGRGWRAGADEAAAGHVLPVFDAAAEAEAEGPAGGGDGGAGLAVAHSITSRVGNASRQAGGNGNLALAFGGNNTSGAIDLATARTAQPGSGYRMDFESETFVAEVAGTLCHKGEKTASTGTGQDARAGLLVALTLRGEGFDASEDGTGRGTPLVAISEPMAFHPEQDPIHSTEVCHAIGKGRGSAQAAMAAFDLQQITHPENRALVEAGRPAPTMAQRSRLHVASMEEGELPPPPVAQHAQVRRLTPRECERLQGLPPDWTLIPWRKGLAPDGPRYMTIGNGMAVPCLEWIGRRIGEVDAEIRGQPAPP